MSAYEGYAADILNEADALLARVAADLDRAAEFYRQNDINPDKVLPALESFIGPKEREEIDRLFSADMDAVQRDVDEAAARFAFSNVPAGGAKKPRALV